jgi:hypothetical protein
VCGRAEAVEPEPRAFAGRAIRAVSDEACAEQRGRFYVVVAGRQRQAVARVGNRVLGVAAVHAIAREGCALAKILETPRAVLARVARAGEPRHADALAFAQRYAAANPHYPPHDLVARTQRVTQMRQLRIEHVQVRAADAARCHFQQDLAVSRGGRGNVVQRQRPPRRVDTHGSHRVDGVHHASDPES